MLYTETTKYTGVKDVVADKTVGLLWRQRTVCADLLTGEACMCMREFDMLLRDVHYVGLYFKFLLCCIV